MRDHGPEIVLLVRGRLQIFQYGNLKTCVTMMSAICKRRLIMTMTMPGRYMRGSGWPSISGGGWLVLGFT